MGGKVILFRIVQRYFWPFSLLSLVNFGQGHVLVFYNPSPNMWTWFQKAQDI